MWSIFAKKDQFELSNGFKIFAFLCFSLIFRIEAACWEIDQKECKLTKVANRSELEVGVSSSFAFFPKKRVWTSWRKSCRWPPVVYVLFLIKSGRGHLFKIRSRLIKQTKSAWLIKARKQESKKGRKFIFNNWKRLLLASKSKWATVVRLIKRVVWRQIEFYKLGFLKRELHLLLLFYLQLYHHLHLDHVAYLLLSFAFVNES